MNIGELFIISGASNWTRVRILPGSEDIMADVFYRSAALIDKTVPHDQQNNILERTLSPMKNIEVTDHSAIRHVIFRVY